jgi:hypothetical protein
MQIIGRESIMQSLVGVPMSMWKELDDQDTSTRGFRLAPLSRSVFGQPIHLDDKQQRLLPLPPLAHPFSEAAFWQAVEQSPWFIEQNRTRASVKNTVREYLCRLLFIKQHGSQLMQAAVQQLLQNLMHVLQDTRPSVEQNIVKAEVDELEKWADNVDTLFAHPLKNRPPLLMKALEGVSRVKATMLPQVQKLFE